MTVLISPWHRAARPVCMRSERRGLSRRSKTGLAVGAGFQASTHVVSARHDGDQAHHGRSARVMSTGRLSQNAPPGDQRRMDAIDQPDLPCCQCFLKSSRFNNVAEGDFHPPETDAVRTHLLLKPSLVKISHPWASLPVMGVMTDSHLRKRGLCLAHFHPTAFGRPRAIDRLTVATCETAGAKRSVAGSATRSHID